jgi:hypothetical protein
MVTTCTITRVPAGAQVTDPLTGHVTTVPVGVYTGPCKVQTGDAMGVSIEPGEVAAELLRYELHLPVVGSETVRRGDLAVITAAATDTAMVGRRLRIKDEFYKTWDTARRFRVEEVT